MSDSRRVVCPRCHAITVLPAGGADGGGGCAKCGEALFTGKPFALTTETFDHHVQNSDVPVLVDFWADWCAPCIAIIPVFKAAAKEMEPHVRLKLDTDEHPKIAGRHAIRGIPTLILFHRGEELARRSGALSLEELKRWVADSLAADQSAAA